LRRARSAAIEDAAVRQRGFSEIVGKTEGMAFLGHGSLALINDDDFGITGGRTRS